MKLSINSKFLEGPYGGGMQFANFIREFLSNKGHTVINHLCDEDIDIILHVNPFPFLTPQASSYSFLEAYRYKLTHPHTIVIERINECDERKGTHYINNLLVKASNHSDFVVFIASWLKPLLENKGLPPSKPNQVILNGADQHIFNTAGHNSWDGVSKLRVVTHHWSNNPKKGHDFYKKLDEILSGEKFNDLFEFTYIGKLPEGINYKNTHVIAPLSGGELAEELKKHHVYLTATQNEPGGMHHIEGALCGLPLLYINSGALPEYCTGFGLEFNEKNFVETLLKMREQYNSWNERIKQYNNTAEKMATQYLETFEKLLQQKELYVFKKNYFYYFYTYLLDFYYPLRFKLFKR